MKVFKEQQHFTQSWLKVLIAISLIVPLALTTQDFLKDTDNISSTKYVLTIIGLIASVGFIFVFKLTTRIDEKGIYYQFFPFHLKFKFIPWTEIDTAKVRTYNPIGEYGGWGLKGSIFWKKSKGKAISISGDIGVQIVLKNGKKLLIGTQKKEEAIAVLKTYQTINNV